MSTFKQDEDKQRTPTFSILQDIPVPEEAILNPVAEYNRGELAAMEDVEIGISFARDVCDIMIDDYYEMRPDFVQGYSDALEFLATREV